VTRKLVRKMLRLISVLTLFTRYVVAVERVRGLSVASENSAKTEGLLIRPSSKSFMQGNHKMSSTDTLMRDSAEKHLTGCAIPPDSNGYVEIPDDWTSIDNYAFFGCSELTSINISASVITIGNDAFKFCSILAEVTFSPGSALTTIDIGAFYQTGLLSLTIPASVNIIGHSAFCYCSSLTEVIFSPGSALTTIEMYTFYQTGLLSVSIPASVTTIGDYAFSRCSILTEVTFSFGSALTTIGNNAFSEMGLLSMTIPASVTTIGIHAFQQCSSLIEVTFSPGSVLTTIGYYVFAETGLLSMTIPASVTNIVDWAFAGCRSLTGVTFSPGSALTTIGNYAFFDTGLLSVTIPASVITIGYNAFPPGIDIRKCAILPDSTGHVDIPEDWTSIDSEAFNKCQKLKSINIPVSVRTIGNYAFFQTGLLSVMLPASVITIGDGAFSDCSSLTEVTFSPGSAFTTIGYHAFFQTGLLSVTIPASVITIGDYAFYRCSSLAEVTFSSGSALTTIGSYAFAETGLFSVTIPASVTTIGNDAFYVCSSLTEVTFSPGSALTNIGNNAFEKYVNFECLDTDVTYSITAFLCRTPCYQANQIRQPTGGCGCFAGSRNFTGECIACPEGHSTLKGGNECIAAKTVSVVAENKCRGYKSIRKVLTANSVSIKYMSSSEEKLLVFSNVTKAFFDAIKTVEVRFMISHLKDANGVERFPNVFSKNQDYYNKRYLLAAPSYTGQTSFDLSFASCADRLLETSRTGKYISKVRLIFYGVPPESMLTFDTIIGCKDYQLDRSSPFCVNAGVCIDNPTLFE
jgi:hypothetical protein